MELTDALKALFVNTAQVLHEYCPALWERGEPGLCVDGAPGVGAGKVMVCTILRRLDESSCKARGRQENHQAAEGGYGHAYGEYTF